MNFFWSLGWSVMEERQFALTETLQRALMGIWIILGSANQRKEKRAPHYH